MARTVFADLSNKSYPVKGYAHSPKSGKLEKLADKETLSKLSEPELGLDELRALRNLAEDKYYFMVDLLNILPLGPKTRENTINTRDRFLTLRDKLTTIIELKDTSRKLGTQS